MRNSLISLICLIVLFTFLHLIGKDFIYLIILIVSFSLVFFLINNFKICFFYFLFTLPLIYQLLLKFSTSSTTLLNLGICLILFAIALFIRMLREKKITIELDSYKLTLMILLLYLVYSIFFISSNTSYGINKFIYFVASILVLLLPSYIITNITDLKKIVIALFSIGLVYSIAANMQYLGFFTNSSNSASIRFNLFSMNPIFFARDISYSILAVIFLLIEFSKDITKNIGKLVILLILLFSLSFFMALTGSRGPLIALLISILVSFAVYQKDSVSAKKIILMNLMILIIISFSLYYLLPEDIIQRLTSGDINNQRTSIIRLFAIMEGLNNFKQNIIFGIGFGSYQLITIAFGKISYPHNIIIEFISETGVIGITLFSIILISTIKMLKKLYGKMDISSFLLILSLFISSFVNANFSGHIGFNLMFWFSCGLIYSITKLYDKK